MQTLRPQIQSLLARLRGRIRRYVLLHAAALVVALAGALFWATFALDLAYFKASSLELPVWFRALVKWGGLVGIPLAAAWLAMPLLKGMQLRALALVLERRFPQLDDRLITAVEAAEETAAHETPLTRAMLEDTIERVARDVERLEIGEVFEPRPLRRALFAAGLVIATMAALTATNAQAMRIWTASWIGLQEEYWDRETQMVARVIAEPGDRVREFGESPRSYDYKHPRGGDLTIQVEVPEQDDRGKSLVVPERVELIYTMPDGRRNVVMSTHGPRLFRHTIVGVVDDVRFRVRGGDFTNRKPYRVTAVDQPKVDRVVLECAYPDYTGLNALADERFRAVRGSEVAVPVETQFRMRAFANKPLVSVRVQTDAFELRLSPWRDDAPAEATLTVLSAEGDSQTAVDLPPQLFWRFRRLEEESALHERLRAVLGGLIALSRAAGPSEGRDGSPATAASRRTSGPGATAAFDASRALAELESAAEEFAGIEADYRAFAENLAANPLYAGDLAARIGRTAPARLAAVQAEELPEARSAVERLRAAFEAGRSRESALAEARAALVELADATSAALGWVSGGRTFEAPLLLTVRGDPGSADGPPIPIAPDTQVRLYLEDADEIVSIDPARVVIRGISDEPPRVEVERRGIGDAITRRASIPVTGRIRDDYGVVTARFEYRVEGAAEGGEDEGGGGAGWQARPFRRPPQNSPRDFRLGREERESAERFDVLPLDLPVGRKLTLTVYAEDGDNLNGPNRARSQPAWTFTIVTNEELLSILYQKEISLRRRFEQIITEVKGARDELESSLARLEEAQPLLSGGSQAEGGGRRRELIDSINSAVIVAADRTFHQVGKNRGENTEIEHSFSDILDELVNNQIHTEQMVDRIRGLIVRPLHDINTVDFPSVDLAIGAYKASNELGEPLDVQMNKGRQAVEEFGTMIAHMERVLSEMADLATFHEAIADLRDIIQDQERVKDQTRERATEALRRLLD